MTERLDIAEVETASRNVQEALTRAATWGFTRVTTKMLYGAIQAALDDGLKANAYLDVDTLDRSTTIPENSEEVTVRYKTGGQIVDFPRFGIARWRDLGSVQLYNPNRTDLPRSIGANTYHIGHRFSFTATIPQILLSQPSNADHPLVNLSAPEGAGSLSEDELLRLGSALCKFDQLYDVGLTVPGLEPRLVGVSLTESKRVLDQD